MLTPNYVTTEDIMIQFGVTDAKKLPSGAFVVPLEYGYVPKHVIDDPRWSAFDKRTQVFCFTHYGIVAVPRSLIRKV